MKDQKEQQRQQSAGEQPTRVALYNCEVKHGGTTTTIHTIQKHGITGQEIVLLRAIHGEDAVLENTIKEAGSREMMPGKLELFELARKYANTSDPFSGKKIVEKVFSVPLIGFESWLEDRNAKEEQEREAAHERRQKDAAEARKLALLQAAGAGA